jgi:hypothetical protein
MSYHEVETPDLKEMSADAHAHVAEHAVRIEGLPEDADPEVAAAVAGLMETMRAKKQTIDLGPELMSELYQYVKENNVRPRIVKSRGMAKRMTAKDPDRYKWRVGERFFMVVARK